MNAVTDNLEPTQSLPDALLVLLFTTLIALAWLNWLPLGVVIAAVSLPFLIRRNIRSQLFAPWGSVYAGASAFLIPPFLYTNLLERLSWMALGMILAFLVGLAFDGVREKSYFAWMAGLVILTLNPSALGIIGVLGLSVLGAFKARASRIRIGVQHQTRSGMVLLALLGLTLAAFSVLLSRPANIEIDGATSLNSQVKPSTKPKTSSMPETQISSPQGSRRVKTQTSDSSLQNIMLLANFALLLVMTALLMGLLRNRLRVAKGSRKPDWTELIPLFGAFLIVLAMFLWSATASPGNGGSRGTQTQATSGGKPRAATPETQPEVSPAQPKRTNPVFSLIMLLVVLAAAYYAYKISREKLNLELPKDPENPDDSSLEARIRATNRVREAYRQFLELCNLQGKQRLNAQTSLEFAAMVTELQPNASTEVLALTKLYEPVRYGQLSDESGALEAERIVEKLKTTLEKPGDKP